VTIDSNIIYFWTLLSGLLLSWFDSEVALGIIELEAICKILEFYVFPSRAGRYNGHTSRLYGRNPIFLPQDLPEVYHNDGIQQRL
jgi:hypothetical protein